MMIVVQSFNIVVMEMHSYLSVKYNVIIRLVTCILLGF